MPNHTQSSADPNEGSPGWTQDLSPEDVKWGKSHAKKIQDEDVTALEATLRKARLFSEARERFNKGTFCKWAEEETGYSSSAASQLASVGDLADEFNRLKSKLPSSWGTLYEIAKEAPEVREKVFERVRPGLSRSDVVDLIQAITSKVQPEPHAPSEPDPDSDDDPPSDPKPTTPEDGPDPDLVPKALDAFKDRVAEGQRKFIDAWDKIWKLDLPREKWERLADEVRKVIEALKKYEQDLTRRAEEAE